jgi:small nuclear ribonucleoprotein (snRNP)-like protein
MNNMILERRMIKMDYNRNENDYKDIQSLHDKCRRCITYHVTLVMRDGSMFEGIIEGVDRESVNLLVGEPVMMEEENENQSYERQEFGRPRRRRQARRFRRRNFPLALVAALDLVPYPYLLPFFLF